MAQNLHLFPGFLRDRAEYAGAEALWRELWQAVVQRTNQQGLWQTPWIRSAFADGSEWRDGNPIFSAVCRPRGLAVRVIQREPAEGLRELDYWTDTFAEGDPQELHELVISCVLAEDTLAVAADIISHWVIAENVPPPKAS